MKVIKIVFGILAALWAIALLAKLFGGSSPGGDLAFSHSMGSVFGILLACAISISLFRSALKS